MRGIGIECTNQAVSVFLRCGLQMKNKGLDAFAAGLAEGLRAQVIGRVGLHQSGIEVVPADEKAKLVPESRLSMIRAVGVRCRVARVRSSALSSPWFRWPS